MKLRELGGKTRRRVLTIVEILIVILIISVLMAMLIPALSGVRIKAMKVACSANLRACGQVLFVDASDNENNFPYKEKAGCNAFFCSKGQGGQPTGYLNIPARVGTWSFGLSPCNDNTTSFYGSDARSSSSLQNYLTSDKIWGCPAVGAFSSDDYKNNQSVGTPTATGTITPSGAAGTTQRRAPTPILSPASRPPGRLGQCAHARRHQYQQCLGHAPDAGHRVLG